MSEATKNLTKLQKWFLWTLWEEEDCWASCAPDEARTARALEERGLIECDPSFPENGRHFEARIRQKGLIKADIAALMSRYKPENPSVLGRPRG